MRDTLPLWPEERQSGCDPNEAPAGYYATPKVYLGENICRQCDWRPTCQKPDTDFFAYGHRCMGYAVVAADGKTYQRNDKCSVVFKRRAERTTDTKASE